MSNKENKPVAKSKNAGKTDGIEDSLLRCEVKLERGEWESPDSCQKFYIDEQANFPDILFEIKTDASPPYKWSWDIQWVVMACKQRRSKNRFDPKIKKTFSDKGSFLSEIKKWKADLSKKIIGGTLTVRVEAGTDIFVRKVFVFGKEPGKNMVDTYLDSLQDKTCVKIAKKIFKQESKYQHFYSDEAPLVSFDNGYGLGQATNPIPSYEQVWNWKKHSDVIISIISSKLNLAKKYLSQSGRSYTDEQLELETLAYYNGMNNHYHVWDEKLNLWVINSSVLCDPLQSNTGWRMSDDVNKDKSLEDLRKGKGSKPIYTGRCYAEHVRDAQ